MTAFWVTLGILVALGGLIWLLVRLVTYHTLAVAAVILIVVGSLVATGASLSSGSTPPPVKVVVTANSPNSCGSGTGWNAHTKKCVANTTKVPAVTGYDVHYYSRDAGVPTGYFGPACVAGGDPAKCKADLKKRVKHDPTLASAMMRDFNLLPGQVPSMTAAQVEQLREQFATLFANDVQFRVKTAAQIATVLDSMTNFSIQALSGGFYTEFVNDQTQAITQTTKQMNPAVNFAMVGTTPDGVQHMIKIDCGYQTVSPKPIVGVPVTPAPTTAIPVVMTPPTTIPVHPGPTPTTTPHPSPTTTPTTVCVPKIVGKDVIECNGTKHCINATACGPNGVNAPPIGTASTTPGYAGSGTAEGAAGAQTPPTDPYKPNPTYGSNPPPGQASPPGADNGNPAGGGSAGVSHPSGPTNPSGGAAQPPTTTVVTTPTGTTIVTSGGNPCEDPNTPGCPGA
jgi:hypothetical protein